MSAFGYVAGHAQTLNALTGIKISFNWVTIIVYGLAIIPAIMYKKYEKMESTIIDDLAKSRE